MVSHDERACNKICSCLAPCVPGIGSRFASTLSVKITNKELMKISLCQCEKYLTVQQLHENLLIFWNHIDDQIILTQYKLPLKCVNITKYFLWLKKRQKAITDLLFIYLPVQKKYVLPL